MKKHYLREIVLLSAPLLLIVGIVLFVQIRRMRAPFINSNMPIRAAFFGADGEIVSIGIPAPAPGAGAASGATLARFNAKSGEKISEVSQNSMVLSPALSPDGHWLASLSLGAFGHYFLSLREVQNGFYERAPLDTGSKTVPRLVWNQKSSGLYLLDKNRAAFCGLNDVVLQSQNGWKQVFGNKFPEGATFSPDGEFVAFSSAPHTVEEIVPGPQTPAGRAFKTTLGYYEDAIKVCSWPDLKVVATFPGDGLGPPTFTPDGHSLLATACFKDGFSVVSAHIARFDLQTFKTRFVKIEADANSLFGMQNARFSPDGRVLVAMNSRISHSFYSAASGRLLSQSRELKAPPRNYWRENGDFSRDGRQFLSVWPEGIEIHDLWEMEP
ncbi:WD40-like Beta Propeller Repeat [Abditibacterium utsteinense]|uniref:WD40-like Beta Propeller Repeat n=1 Tax=Abditibacterium utsteinense TaxID=1960156 RepID=A0A2S8SRI9_9BACT|nr:hypothetical protein [Abditibacterium utsteinense]PQV63423.1 WD40-like Beta Propeller Repeat [Abditibacterium utsteinense]